MKSLRIGADRCRYLRRHVGAASDWPNWRGPAGNGIADERNLPERWSATENVAWKARPRRTGRVEPDRFRRSRVRHVADRIRRPQARQPSASRAGRCRRERRRARARCAARGGAANGAKTDLRRRSVQPRRWQAAMGAPRGRDRRAAWRSRQTQSREPEPRHRWADGVRVVRHRATRRARHERQARVATASRPGEFAVRHQLGPRQLADAVRRFADPALRSRTGRVSPRG